MEKNELLAWEHKCIQDEAPECTASCPLHLDARSFLREMARGDGPAAFKVLAKSMPFPGILSRICDHPCEQKCKRGEAGEAIAIGALERACVAEHGGPRRVMPLPRKDQRIAVLGAGLAGLTAAFDLLKKGFRVTIFESSQRLGGRLWEFPERRLPEAIITQELAVLEALKAEIHFGEQLDTARLGQLCSKFDALFIDRDVMSNAGLPLAVDAQGLIAIEPRTGASGHSDVFAGGGTALTSTFSPVLETFSGRRGALSIERYLQKVHMDIGREQEGPYPTRLYTNLDGITPSARVAADEEGDYNAEKARQEAQRCIQCECLECVKVCHFLKHYQSYPKVYARKVFNNERVIHGAPRSANKQINSCSNCGLCQTVCPNDLHMGDLCLQSRREMVEQKAMPASFHEFALTDLAHSQGEDFALGRHQVGCEQSYWLYFPSCQLCATAPGEVLNSYSFLQEKLTGGVGILLGCCGAPAWWAGQQELFHESLEQLRSEWQRLGQPKLITACVTCQALFAEHLPELSTVPLWRLLGQTGLPEDRLQPKPGTSVAVADPCMSRQLPQLQQVVRRLVGRLGFEVAELPLNKAKSECCGYGGLMSNANPQLATEVISQRLVRAAEDRDYLAYCAMCRDNFAAAGKRVSHLLEHLFPNCSDADPAARRWISWTQRRDNRTRVKTAILQQHSQAVAPAEITMHLTMSDDVRRRLDTRRILDEDLRQTINHAETSGKRLRNNETGCYRACCQLANVTFWVDYEKTTDGYTVHNAFSHRMRIVGVKT